MIQILKGLWASRDRRPLYKTVVWFAAGMFTGGLAVAWLLRDEETTRGSQS